MNTREAGCPRIPVWALLALLASPCAGAQVSLVYEGSLKLPTRNAVGGDTYFQPEDYYADHIVYVADGHPRPAWAGAPVSGPSLIVVYPWAHNTVEYHQLPALSTTGGGLGTAVLLHGTNGGTRLPNCAPIWDVDSAGNIWGAKDGATTSTAAEEYSDPGVMVLGVTNLSAGYGVKESGWPGNYALGGFIRRGNGLGGVNPTDGTQTGAVFVAVNRPEGGGSTNVKLVVYNCTRTSPTTMNSVEQFRIETGLPWAPDTAHNYRFRYLRATDNREYFLRWLYGGRSGDNFTVDVYGATVTGTNPTATVNLNIGPSIAAGPGWINASSQIQHIYARWEDRRLYVLEEYLKDARVHVFLLQGAAPAGTVFRIR